MVPQAAARRKPLVQQTRAIPASIPAPIGGWNARDSLANMAPTDAVVLTNMFPGVSSVNIRGGYSQHATGMSGQIQSLMVYSGGATNEMFAAVATANKIYDVTINGAVGAAVVSGLANAQWEYANITTAGGSYLMAVNGADTPLLYDGSSWGTASISGVTSSNLSNILLFKNRLWFIEKNTLKAWYLPTQSISGAAQMFDLRSVCKQGGYLVAMGAWTVDAGYGVDDNLVFITSNGEVLVYRGTDPASSATWAAAGVWQLGAPIGKRCMLKYGGDILILTYDGLFPLAQALQSSRLDPRVALSDKIQGAIAEATKNYASTFGWQIVYYPKENAVFVNVPVSIGQQEQWPMNTITTAWCNFTGWAANCWALFNDDVYFGGDGVVCHAWDSTFADNDANINTSSLQAFNYFQMRGIEKYFTRARPVIFTNGSPAIQVGMNVDFEIVTNSSPISFTPSTVGLWDQDLWDVAIWGQSLQRVNNWQGITGIGYCGAIQFQSASKNLDIQWAATDVVFQTGWGGI